MTGEDESTGVRVENLVWADFATESRRCWRGQTAVEVARGRPSLGGDLLLGGGYVSRLRAPRLLAAYCTRARLAMRGDGWPQHCRLLPQRIYSLTARPMVLAQKSIWRDWGQDGTVLPRPSYAARRSWAFPWDTVPCYLLRDRDKAYGPAFLYRIRAMGITEVITAPRSPWQNPTSSGDDAGRQPALDKDCP
jgi:hypothetical protein